MSGSGADTASAQHTHTHTSGDKLLLLSTYAEIENEVVAPNLFHSIKLRVNKNLYCSRSVLFFFVFQIVKVQVDWLTLDLLLMSKKDC